MIRPYTARLIAAFIFSLLASGASGILVWMIKPVTDFILIENNSHLLNWLPFIIVAAFAIMGSLKMIYSYLMFTVVAKFVRDLRVRLFDHLLVLPVSSIYKESPGNMVSRIHDDARAVQRLLNNISLGILQEVPTVIVLICVAFIRRWDVSLLAVTVFPLIAFFTFKKGATIKEKRKNAQVILAQLFNLTFEGIAGAKDTKSFCNEARMSKVYAKENYAHYEQERQVLLHTEKAKLAVLLCTGAGIALGTWYCVRLVVSGVITPGDLLSVFGAMSLMFEPIRKLSKTYLTWKETKVSINRIFWLLDMHVETGGDTQITTFTDEIRYSNVSLRYSADTSAVLHDINLAVSKGERIAIVGESGAGKTSIVNLLLRFYDPCHGTITLDGHDLKTLRLENLRKLISVVGQDNVLFHDTIKNNILFGCEGKTGADAEKAARLANAHEFICQMPQGYDTVIKSLGKGLSGGQTQRISIARAFMKNAPILILDEATSSIDSASEKLIQESLDILTENKTTIVIAHRFSTISDVDRIAVVQHGKIISKGTHDHLMENCQEYQRLYSADKQRDR